MRFEALSQIAPAAASSTKPSSSEVIWHLTLDQILPGTGHIVNRVYAPASEAGSSTYCFDEGNVLYSKLRPYLNKVICPDSFGVATNELVPLRPDSRELDRNYLCFYLRSPKFVSWASSQVDGAKMPRIKMKSFWAHQIPLPPLDDQIRIAYLLSKVESLIAHRKQQLQQLDDLLKSVFLQMFGDPIANPKNFPVRELSEFYINPEEGTRCGPFGSALKKEELVDSGIPVWNMDNIDATGRMLLPFRMWITEDKYRDLISYSVVDGDIIISRAGTVGKMCVAKMNGAPAIISTNLIRLRLGEKLRPLYVVSLMTYCKGRVGRLKTGADGAFTHMNTGILDKLEFPSPPVELQNEFAAIVENVEGVRSRCQQCLSDLESLYGALSQKAFKGDLDLSRVMIQPTTGVLELKGYAPSVIVSQVGENRKTVVLPEVENMAAAFATPEGRQRILSHWLDSYLRQVKGSAFSVNNFLEAVQTRLAELQPEDGFRVGIVQYDQLKDWVFAALRNGKLSQVYDDPANRVQLLATNR